MPASAPSANCRAAFSAELRFSTFLIQGSAGARIAAGSFMSSLIAPPASELGRARFDAGHDLLRLVAWRCRQPDGCAPAFRRWPAAVPGNCRRASRAGRPAPSQAIMPTIPAPARHWSERPPQRIHRVGQAVSRSAASDFAAASSDANGWPRSTASRKADAAIASRPLGSSAAGGRLANSAGSVRAGRFERGNAFGKCIEIGTRDVG